MQTADVVLTTYKDGDIRQNRRGNVDPRRFFRHPGFSVIKSDWLKNYRKSMYQGTMVGSDASQVPSRIPDK